MSPIPLKENSTFKTNNVKQMSKSFNIAVLHNLILNQEKLQEIEILNVVNLNPIDISLDHFLDLFYSTHSKYFSIKKSNRFNDLITFNKQYYSSTNHHKNRFSLVDQQLHTYSLKHNIDVENINSLHKVLLHKEIFNLQSLSKLSGSQISLDWDQVISSLIENNYIVPSCNPLSVANVSFEVTANVFSKSLNVWSSVVFTYNTKLNGFKNVSECCDQFNESVKSYSHCSQEFIKPFYSSNHPQHNFVMDNEYEGESDNGVSHSKANSDSDEHSLEPEPVENVHHVVENKLDNKQKHLETLKELEDEDLPDLDDETSVIYTINNELLEKIKHFKNNSNESICTWEKN